MDWWFAWHSLHVTCPGLGAYSPEGQPVHPVAWEPLWERPLGHERHNECPEVAAKRPGTQPRQFVLPVELWYFPWGQFVHKFPDGRCLPLGQELQLDCPLELVDCPEGHLRQNWRF